MSSSYKPIVAIAGLNGALGQQTLAALLSPQFISYFQLPIRVLTRNPSNLDGYVYSADMAQYLYADYNDPEVLDAALENVDVVINLLGMYPRSWIRLGEAAYRIGAKLYIPSEFGPDHRYFNYQSPFAQKQVQSDRAREDGIKSVQIFCGIFMEHAIPSGRHLGIDLPSRRVIAVVPAGRSEPRVSFTSVRDVAMTIASVASRRPSSLPDAIRIAGDTWTLRQLGEYYQSLIGARVHVTTQNYSAFSASVLHGGHQSISSHYQLAAGAGLLDYSTNSNEWASAGMWQWRSIQHLLAGI
ncbi:NAD(P)-binding protein [Choiromyces venosus 120613-1]|uniref:NAD(P)-binding protein n=1 Tax=Choiromyces venosus 120613-1 TaxID=1336337 RepID=A0A3N4KA24_9PEZI|nr:NAD(P)-binding protein [Choiromyces venosus 120613-1]